MSARAACLFLMLLCLVGAAPCGAEERGGLPGTYRVLWSDGRPNDHVFKVERVNDEWRMSDDEAARPYPMWGLDREDFEEIATSLKNPNLLNAACVDSGGASRIIVCATNPGEKLSWRGRELVVTTGYFVFMGFEDLFLLEKTR